MGLANFRYYYWACNISKLLYWSPYNIQDEYPQWASLETSSSCSSLWSVVCSQLPITTRRISSNPVVTNTLMIWTQFRKPFGLHAPSIRSPICHNHIFSPSCSDRPLDLGLEKAFILFYYSLLKIFFPALQTWQPSSAFLTHICSASFILTLCKISFPHFPNRPPETITDQLLSLSTGQKGLITSVYNRVHTLSQNRLTSLRAAWDRDLGTSLSDECCERILNHVHTSSICAKHGLLQCKILHRVHLTKARLARIYPYRTDECNNCHRLLEYWSNIQNN